MSPMSIGDFHFYKSNNDNMIIIIIIIIQYIYFYSPHPCLWTTEPFKYVILFTLFGIKIVILQKTYHKIISFTRGKGFSTRDPSLGPVLTMNKVEKSKTGIP